MCERGRERVCVGDFEFYSEFSEWWYGSIPLGTPNLNTEFHTLVLSMIILSSCHRDHFYICGIYTLIYATDYLTKNKCQKIKFEIPPELS